MNKFVARVYQKFLFVASKFLKFREPYIYKSKDSFVQFINDIKEKNYRKIMFVTGKTVCKLDLFNEMLALLKENNLDYFLFNEVSPDPSIVEIEKGVQFFKENNCDLIISVGGGSSIDAGKIIAARITNNKPISKMKGLLKITKNPIYFVAIPTTAGTGSECTIAAVVSDKENNKKFAISDPKLIPSACIFIPEFLTGLSPRLIASTGMDALTHAVEAYIGHSNTRKTKNDALQAIKLIKENLLKAYQNPSDLQAQSNMQFASYLAGRAFTKAYVGNVHALAHSFGAYCHISHGFANAVILPHVLKYYGKTIDKKSKEISNFIDLDVSLIDWINNLNKSFNIPNKFDIDISNDLNNMIEHAYKEAVPLYPSPMVFTKKDFKNLFEELTIKKETY